MNFFFTGVFAKLRLESSGYPKDVSGYFQEEDFCRKLSRETGFELETQSIVKNDALRMIAKTILGQF